jgi:hypothetical protein
MAITREVTDFDIVELTEAAYDAPAGAKGGVLEICPDGIAMLEILEPELDAAARIVFAPVDKLHHTTRPPHH